MESRNFEIAEVAKRLKGTTSGYAFGYEEGTDWAKTAAEIAELEVIEDWDEDEAMSRSGAADAAVQLALDLGYDHRDSSTFMEGRVTESRLRGFLAGVRQVWSEAKKLI